MIPPLAFEKLPNTDAIIIPSREPRLLWFRTDCHLRGSTKESSISDRLDIATFLDCHPLLGIEETYRSSAEGSANQQPLRQGPCCKFFSPSEFFFPNLLATAALAILLLIIMGEQTTLPATDASEARKRRKAIMESQRKEDAQQQPPPQQEDSERDSDTHKKSRKRKNTSTATTNGADNKRAQIR